jgi:hypothetical protein
LFYRGEYRLAWEALWLAAKWLRHRKYITKEYAGKVVDGVSRLCSTFNLSERISGVQLMVICTTYQVTNPHDKVYALLGILDSILGAELVAAFIRADYTKPLHSVYTSAVRMFIHSKLDREASNALSVLSFVGRLKPREEGEMLVPLLPSWVPSLNLRFKFDMDEQPFIATKSHGAADGLLPVVHRPHDPETPVLRLQGVVFDSVIANVTSKFESLDSDQISPADLVIEYCLLWALLRQQLPNDPSLQKKYASTLVHGRVPLLRDKSSAKAEDEVASQFNILLETLASNANSAILRNASTGQSDAVAAVFDSVLSLWITSAIFFLAKGRALFVTKRGFIGMAPPSIQHGDTVCILFGAHVPFALRSEGHRWKLIGDVYVDDLMDVS